MPRFRTLAAGVAAVAVAAVGLPANAQTDVDVTLSVPDGTRVVHVEDMSGAPLTSLDFGETDRSLPFRVRVEDTAMEIDGFNVYASMTHLYTAGERGITSANVSLGSQTNPLNVLEVTSTVQPLVNTTTILTDSLICNVLEGVSTLLPAEDCTLQTTGVTGKIVEDLVNTINLADLDNLPLVPTGPEELAFTYADFGVGTAADDANDTDDDGQPTTLRRVIGANPTDAVLFSELDDALDDLAATSLTSVVDTNDVLAALQAQYPLVWGLLSQAQITELLTATTAQVQDLSLTRILAQTGQYISLPTLDVDTTDAPAGEYVGTLVITGIQ